MLQATNCVPAHAVLVAAEKARPSSVQAGPAITSAFIRFQPKSSTRCATMILLAHSDSRVHPRAALWVPHRLSLCPIATLQNAQNALEVRKLHYSITSECRTKCNNLFRERSLV